MRSALVAGAFGQRNVGDEALLEAICAGLPGVDVVATSAHPRRTTREHGVPAVPAGNPIAVSRTLSRVDGVVVAGGSVSSSARPATAGPTREVLRRAYLLGLAARTAGRPYAVVGMSVEALEDERSRGMARSIARSAGLLLVRDSRSASVLTAAGVPGPVRVGPDPTWVLLDHSGKADPGREDVVVVAVGQMGAHDSALDCLADALAAVAADGMRVELQPWQHGGREVDDFDVARALHRRLPGSVVTPAPADLREARNRYRAARLVVAMRYHAVVAAACAGAPLVAVGDDVPTVLLAEQLGQPTAPLDAATLPALLRGALDGNPADPAVVRGLVGGAHESFRLLRVLLHGGGEDSDTVGGLTLEPSP